MRFLFDRWLVGLTTFFTLLLFILTFSMSQFRYEEVEDVIENILPAVVQIGVANEPSTEVNTIGSGIILTKDGYVLTSKHNLVDADHLFVKMIDGKPLVAIYYVADAHRDLAILRIDPGKLRLPVVEIGDSDSLKVGQTVFAIGYPSPSFIQDDNPTVSRGVVSALKRILTVPATINDEIENNEVPSLSWSIHYMSSFTSPLEVSMTPQIQMDAAVNHGSSGGPVITSDGKVVGIVRSMLTNTGSNVGMNFAIPINEAKILLTLAGVEEEDK